MNREQEQNHNVTPVLNTISIDQLLSLIRTDKIVLIDVRSPGEFGAGNIRGAVNIPLLNNEERHQVGITYKQSGSDQAVHKGFDLVGKKFSDYISSAKELAPKGNIYIYCWRGGMRSQIMAWLLATAGLKVSVLSGGYKSYRQWCYRVFSQERKMNILRGLTGTGKTEILHSLKGLGESTIDLEGLAHHRGSSFGGINQPLQPSQEQFENELAWHISLCSVSDVLWLEDESRFIGRVRIPDLVYTQMQNSHFTVLHRSTNERINRILNEYGSYPKDALDAGTRALTKRMGGDQVKLALDALHNDDMIQWAGLLLHYYDKTYLHSNGKKLKKIETEFTIENQSPEEVARIILDKSETIV